MPIDGINTGYNNTINKYENAKNKNGLSMDDFFQLMVAQLANQDMFNTVDDTQFIAQMAQFSMVQALSELSKASATAYSMSLIGKEATVARFAVNGQLESIRGIVDSVILYNGEPEITIDGEKYALSSIMQVNEPNIIIPRNDFFTSPQENNTSGRETNNAGDGGEDNGE